MVATPEWIRIARQARGMDTVELAQALDVPLDILLRWESELRLLEGEALDRLAHVLDFPIAFFYQPTPEPLRFICCQNPAAHP